MEIKVDAVYVIKLNSGHSFLVSPHASSNPEWFLNSFLLEKELRDKWWTIQQGDVVIDVGAAYGSYTLSALAMGAAKVYSYEPSTNDCFDLVMNLALNKFNDRCMVLPFLAGNEAGFCYAFNPNIHRRGGDQSVIRLLTPVDSLLPDLTRLDWVKIDVEGMELDVLQGAKQIITKFKPNLLIEEHVGFVPGIDKKIAEFLNPLGYTSQTMTGQGVNDRWSLWKSK